MPNKFILTALIVSLALVAVLLCTGCDMKPDPQIGASQDGIVMYSGTVILNGATWEIVTGRVQQLRATGPSGHNIAWNSSNTLAIEVTQTGLIRVGPSPNKEAIISAYSINDPSIKAEVTFKTKGLR
jgi:hypothetical protein